MFTHNFKYIFKALLKNKMLIFWTFAFPILLGIFFNMAFSDLENNEKLDIIDIAIVNDEQFNTNLIISESFKNLSDKENENRLFNIEYVNEKKAKDLLEDKKITGYVIIEDELPKVVIASNGINETVLKYVTEEITQNYLIVSDLSQTKIKQLMASGDINIDYNKIYQGVISIINNTKVNIENKSSNNLSYTVIEFYTLIAMSCLYGGMIGMTAINYTLANMSNKGKRIGVSPVSKSKTILSSVCASFLIQLIGVFLLLFFTIFILKVDYGSNLLLVIILAIIGSLAGLTLGLTISVLLKSNENAKTGIIIAFTMVCCFLSGMMGITMKYIIDKNIPIINKINPAAMITDGFYSLYYYDTLDRYFLNIISLIFFSIIMIIIATISLRRKKYDSI